MADSSWNSQSSSSEGSSSSVPTITQTPQSGFSLNLADLLAQLGQQQYNWAMNEYARAGSVTDAQINNFVNLAQQGQGLAGNLIGRYTGTYAPLEDAYAREAQTYDSDARRMHEMGAAEARAQQAQNAAKINAENELESFGIDPSSGRYQDLILASNTKGAADAAAAGEAARIATEQEGQRRKLNAIAIGQQLPGAGVNALQSAYTGVSGAVNAALGLANTGANLSTSASKFFDPAMHPLQPLQGQTSQSGQSSRGSGSGGSSSPGGSGSRSGGGDPFGGGRGRNPDSGYGYQPTNSNNGGSPSNGVNPSGFMQPDPLFVKRDPTDPFGGWGDLGTGLAGMGGLSGTHVDPWDYMGPDQNAWNWGGQGGRGILPGDASNWGIQNPDTANWGNFGNGQEPTDGSASSGGWWNSTPDTAFPDAPGDVYGADPYIFNQNDYNDYGGWDQDPMGGYSGASDFSDYGGWDNTGGSSDSGSWGDGGSADYAGWGDYAQGGPVSRYRGGNNQPQGGGFVPPSMSPSGGQRVDDIQAVVPQTGGRAQINAGEFVLPRDVVAWKGQEFFQNMIKKARQARTGAPAKPSSRPTGGFNG